MRQAFRAQGVGIAEFPVNEETAREAAAAGDFIVFGAPNVVRGGSHTGWTKASDMIAKGLCSVLASDYYYPAPLLAAFRLAADGVLPLAQGLGFDFGGAGARRRPCRSRRARRRAAAPTSSWSMTRVPLRPRIVAVIAAGRLVHLTDASRLRPFDRRAAQGGCSRVTRLYSDDNGKLSPLRDLLRCRRPAARSIASARSCSATTPMAATTCPFRTACADDAGLARADAGSAQIRLSRHAEGADGAGRRQDRSSSLLLLAKPLPPRRGRIPIIAPVVNSISGFIAVIPSRAIGRTGAACRRLRRATSMPSARRSRRRIARGAIRTS